MLSQSPGKDDALLFAAGEGLEVPRAKAGQPYGIKRLPDDLIVLHAIALKCSFMGRTPGKHDLINSKIKCILIVLGDNRHTSGGSPDAHLMKRCIIKKNLAGIRL